MKDIYATIYRSQAYKDLLWYVEKIQRQAKSAPENKELEQELCEARQQLKAFMQNALELAVDLEKAPLNTNQLRLAKHQFDTGDYALARATLKDEKVAVEQVTHQPVAHTPLTDSPIAQDKTDSFINRTISHNLTGSLAQICESFEQTLSYMGRIPQVLFDYAHFLQENSQHTAAEQLYREALANYRDLALNNSTQYLPNIAMTLNNLAYLIQTAIVRRKEVELLYREALDSYRKLAAVYPNVYQPHVANTLWGFAEAHLYWQESQQAVELLENAANIIAPFAKQYPPIFAVKQQAILNTLLRIKNQPAVAG